MDAIAPIVGIDVSKDRLDVHVRGPDDRFDVPRDTEGIAALVERLRAVAPKAIGLEATGGPRGRRGRGASPRPACPSSSSTRPRSAPLPARSASGRRTDAIDAAVIAHFIEATAPEIRPLQDAETRLLAELVARRRQIVAMMTSERQRRARRAGAGCARASTGS